MVRAVAVLSDGAALVLGLACLLLALAAQGGRVSARLDLLTHFAPIWCAGAAFALGYGLVVSSPPLRNVILIAGAAGVLAAAALMLPEMIRPIQPLVGAGGGRRIKLIQFNAWDENTHVDATADWVAAQAPDLVLMQEVEDPMRAAMVQRGFRVLHGMSRTAIFSRLTPIASPYRIPTDDWPILPSFSRATFADPGGAFSLVSVHVGWPTRPETIQQMQVLADILDHYPTDRLILAGDFNLTPWSFALRRYDQRLGMERRDRAMFSWPARLFPRHPIAWPLAVMPIDHVYAGNAWRTVSIARGPRLGSDHYPLVVTLALTN